MNETCKKCGAVILSTKPPRFSLLDKYGVQRRIAKKEIESKSN
jgi:rRNA maturation protein Nop10